MIYLRLYHGRPIDPATGEHPDLEDWGSVGPEFALHGISQTYGNSPFVFFSEELPGDSECWFEYHEDLIFYDGVGYGDWSVMGQPDRTGSPPEPLSIEKMKRSNYLSVQAIDHGQRSWSQRGNETKFRWGRPTSG